MRLNKAIIEHVLYFIRSRHVGDIRSATEHQAFLKRRLRNAYSKVLLQHGDPDRDYMAVMNRWLEEERVLLR